MMTAATYNVHDNTPRAVLFMAFELSENTWKFGFSMGHGQKPRARTMTARDLKCLLDEVAQAKSRFGLSDPAPVVSCYEAGREGFWLHRFLQAQRITNQVVDSSSIAVKRRQRWAKSDGLDVRQLLTMLIPLGRLLGRLIDGHPKTIWAYSMNVLGSLVGVWLFVTVSRLYQPLMAWFIGCVPW